jgi:hypothetical protein
VRTPALALERVLFYKSLPFPTDVTSIKLTTKAEVFRISADMRDKNTTQAVECVGVVQQCIKKFNRDRWILSVQ